MDAEITVEQIVSCIKEHVKAVYGNATGYRIKYLQPLEKVDEFTLDWINIRQCRKQEIAEASKAKVIIASEEVAYSEVLRQHRKILIVVDNPNLAIAKIGRQFFNPGRFTPGIHPSAIVHQGAMLGENIVVGEFCNIVKCKIGNNVVIFPHVTINDNVQIGNNVIIKPGAVLGYEGFGFEKDHDGTWVKFPQIGQLIIEDEVEIGANTCIDRGSLSDTIIGFGTKINNLCHIAHNTVIGRNVIITSHVAISGSTVIEDNVWIGPNATLRGHQIIHKSAFIGAGAVVTKDVPEGEIWVGNPAKKLG